MNTKFELQLTREISVSPQQVWKAWTSPEVLKQWWTPKPWRTVECEIDLQIGGRFYTRMQGPNGEDIPGEGCILRVEENKNLAWTDCLLPGFRPASEPFMTAVLTVEDLGNGNSQYTATVYHKDEAGKKKHEEMGFFDGWGTALSQLVEVAKSL